MPDDEDKIFLKQSKIKNEKWKPIKIDDFDLENQLFFLVLIIWKGVFFEKEIKKLEGNVM